MAKYDVKDINGNEFNDLEEDAIAALVNQDQVTGTCSMKKAIMREWKVAKKFEFLATPLAEQAMRFAKAKDEGGNGDAAQELAKAEDKKYRPVPADVSSRLNAFKYEFIRAAAKLVPLLLVAILAIYGIAFFTGGSLPAPNLPKQPGQKSAKAVETTFAQLDEESDFTFGSKFIDKTTKVEYICLNPAKGNAIWCKADFPVQIFTIAFFIFFFWEILALGYPLCTTQQTRGMAEENIILENAKDIRIEVVALQSLPYVVLSLILWPVSGLFVLALKHSPMEFATYTCCAKLSEK